MGGCLAKVVIPSFKRDKIGPKTCDSIFIGYAFHSAAYRFLVKDARCSYACVSIVESRDAEFFEHVFPLKCPSTTSSLSSSDHALFVPVLK